MISFLLVFFSANLLHNSASEIPSFFALAMWQNLISKVVKASKKLITFARVTPINEMNVFSISLIIDKIPLSIKQSEPDARIKYIRIDTHVVSLVLRIFISAGVLKEAMQIAPKRPIIRMHHSIGVVGRLILVNIVDDKVFIYDF